MCCKANGDHSVTNSILKHKPFRSFVRHEGSHGGSCEERGWSARTILRTYCLDLRHIFCRGILSAHFRHGFEILPLIY